MVLVVHLNDCRYKERRKETVYRFSLRGQRQPQSYPVVFHKVMGVSRLHWEVKGQQCMWLLDLYSHVSETMG